MTIFVAELSYVDVNVLIVAFVGTGLYQLACLVSASTWMDVEGADYCTDDWGIPVVIRRLRTLY